MQHRKQVAQLHEGEHRQQELSSNARRRRETSNGAETFAYLGIHAGKAFVGHITGSGIVAHEYATLSGKSDCENGKETARGDIVNASRCVHAGYSQSRRDRGDVSKL